MALMLAAIPYTTFPDHRPGVRVAADVRPGRRVRGPRSGRGSPLATARSSTSLATSPTASPCGWWSLGSSARASPGCVTHLDELESPLEAFAIWQGGLQFSGGFVFAVIAGYPIYHHWNRLTRWHSLDGYAYGLAIGLGIGRIGCYAVGEHFGSLTSFPLAVRYDGGSVREPFLGTTRLEPGHGVPPDRPLRAPLHGGAVPAPHLRPLRPQAAAGPGHRRGDLLRLLRGRPLRLRPAPGQRRDACSGSPARSTSASPCCRRAPGSGSGSASSWRATSRPACRWAWTRRNRRMRKQTYRR